MKRKIISVILASLIMTGCGNSQLSEVAESVETTVTATTTTEETKTTTTTTTVETTTTQTTTTTAEQTTTTIPEPTEDEAGGVFDVDRGIFITKLTMPSDVLENGKENFDAEKIVSDANSNGEDWLIDAELDGDNVIFTVKTSMYNKIRKDTIDELRNIVEQTTNESETINEITFNDEVSDFYAYVTSEEEYNKSMDGVSLWGMMVGASMSHYMFRFFSDEMTLHIIDSQTGVEFKTDVYPKKSDE